MKRFYLFSLIGISLFLGSCCGNCEKTFVDSFELDSDARDIFNFTVINERIFENELGNEILLTYTDPFSGFRDQVYDCTEEGSCGLCCHTFQSGFLYTQLQAVNFGYTFDISLDMDYRQFTPFDPAEDVETYLSLNFNNLLNCEVSDILNTNFTETVELNGTEYGQIYSCAISGGGGVTPNSPVRCYFSKTHGIVGFEVVGTPENIIWSLVL